MILKIVVSSVLALSAVNALAGNMYIHKDKGGQVLLTNVNPSGKFDKFTKKVKVTYSDGSYSTPRKVNGRVADVASNEEINQAIEKLSDEANKHYKSKSYTDSAYTDSAYTDSAYADSAYTELR